MAAASFFPLRVDSRAFAVRFLSLSFGFQVVRLWAMRAFLVGLVIGIIVVPAAGFLYVWLGYMPVSTKAAPLPFERKLAGIAIEKRIEKEAPKNRRCNRRNRIF
jgi:hypothetical protein